MPFLEDLFFGKRDSDRRQSTQDGSLTGAAGGDLVEEAYEPHTSMRSRGLAGAERTPEGFAAEARKICGNIYCGAIWTAPWKRRAQPIFEGKWACSSRCLSAMVRAALAREAGEGDFDDGPEPHHHRIPLGLVILAQGWITHPELQKALEAQRRHGNGRIGEWLVSECGMKPERIAGGLGVQWNCPVLSTESFWPEAMALALPRVFLEEYGAVPLRLAGKKILYIGFRDSLDASASFALEQMTGLKTESGVLPEAEFIRARETLMRCAFAPQTLASVSDRDALVRAIAGTIEHEKPEASRLVRLHRYYWLRVWAKAEGNRSAGDLPATSDGVTDYLFTIGSRIPRSIQEETRDLVDSRMRPIAGQESDYIFEEPVIRVFAEPATVKASDDAHAEPDFGDLATRITEQPEAVAIAAEVDGAEYDAEEEDSVEAQALVDRFIAQARSSRDHIASMSLSDFAETEPTTRSDELWSSLQRRNVPETHTIEGEYLPLIDKLRSDPESVGSSALVRHSSGLSRIGRMLRLRPSYPDPELDRVADRDRGV